MIKLLEVIKEEVPKFEHPEYYGVILTNLEDLKKVAELFNLANVKVTRKGVEFPSGARLQFIERKSILRYTDATSYFSGRRITTIVLGCPVEEQAQHFIRTRLSGVDGIKGRYVEL